jgi:GntR family transcriptional regulator/MocR family aminotransferase
MALAINIEPASPIAIHRQIYEAWRRGILSGRFAAGDRLPSTRELAVTLAVSRSTVSQAYEQLISEGYLQAARGSGTFVCRELPDRSLHAQVAVKLTPHRAVPPPLSRYGSGLSDDYPHEPCRAGFVCFSQWGPDLVQFPWMLWRRTLSRHLRQTRHDVFDYAQQVEGYEPLRREIAAWSCSLGRAANRRSSSRMTMTASIDTAARLCRLCRVSRRKCPSFIAAPFQK